ncbi:hypothetical protein AUC61_01140 [Pseudomonas sp. S25]|uniref:Uncharacterized protein n=1 Tax=Pseudomonas maioricensis TaxID=1766623 RepID=A0ABS9ZDN2_9PSED|nr:MULTISPECIES: hypothetical protein [Pseudomonas]MCI8208126.1 hypothetical protein [Pseudomonas sp. S25]
MKNLALELHNFFERLSLSGGSAQVETAGTFRIDEVSNVSIDFVRELKDFASRIKTAGLGLIELFGEVSDSIEVSTFQYADIENDRLTIILEKPVERHWCYFLTLKGFENWLRAGLSSPQQLQKKMCIWVAGEVIDFSTYSFSVTEMGGHKDLPTTTHCPEKPWKTVRDLTQAYAPSSLEPWLLLTEPVAESETFKTWKNVAVEKLAFCLPTEIRREDGGTHVVFRGGRSLPITVEEPINWTDVDFITMHETCQWIYSTPRESETKFQLFNNHIAINWNNDATWPSGLKPLLRNSLSGAKEAFAFHLQDQSKEAVKSLGDLRKGLQEEVNKTQTATRDLISALWRDFAVAGIVLALRTPMVKTGVETTAMTVLYLGVSALLIFSILINTLSNLRFNSLGDSSREGWRKKLYSFMSADDWHRLVEKPISAGRTVYWFAWTVCFFLYASIVHYFLSLAAPDVVDKYFNSYLVSMWNCIKNLLSIIYGSF